MSRYTQYTHSSNGTIPIAIGKSRDHRIYGSSRVGIDNNVQVLYTSGAAITTMPTTYERLLSMKSYELSNHLGNVLVTVTTPDFYRGVYNNGGSNVYFEAETTKGSSRMPLKNQYIKHEQITSITVPIKNCVYFLKKNTTHSTSGYPFGALHNFQLNNFL